MSYVRDDELVRAIKSVQEQLTDLCNRIDALANSRIEATNSDLTATQVAVAEMFETTP